MSRHRQSVAEQRGYMVRTAAEARQICDNAGLLQEANLGPPEVDDRRNVWRVPLLRLTDGSRVGEVVINAYTGGLSKAASNLPGTPREPQGTLYRDPQNLMKLPLNALALGDSEVVLGSLPTASVQLVFTSPPYYNARPECTSYTDYRSYLNKLHRIITEVRRVLAHGRFFVINVSPVLVRRTSRKTASRRIAVPFDVHQLFMRSGYEFVDDIIWQKPEGAGWATGRGRRFAADRNPLQYKPVPVTEYVLVYRRDANTLIDQHIRKHPNKALVRASRIEDDYERTNIWRITPAHDKRHPAVFPVELAARVIRYYSFKGDVVLDPFAGIGTVGKAAAKLGRRFILIESERQYVKAMQADVTSWFPDGAPPQTVCLAAKGT